MLLMWCLLLLVVGANAVKFVKSNNYHAEGIGNKYHTEGSAYKYPTEVFGFKYPSEGYEHSEQHSDHKGAHNGYKYHAGEYGHNEYHRKGYGYGPRFYNAKEIGVVRDSRVTGTSGICASRSHPGYLYAVNDHGAGPLINVIDNKTGKVVSVITVKGAVNADWEDLACGPCPGYGNCIYIADSGNDGGNNVLYSNTIYRVKEPASIKHDITVYPNGKLEYCWNEFDTETLMVDPYANLYIISRTKPPKGVSKIAYIPNTAWKSHKKMSLTKLTSLKSYINGANLTAGDISRNGKEILLLTFDHLYHFTVKTSILRTLSKCKPVTVPYKVEPKGQAVSFDAKGRGYCTLGEGERQTLYCYRRKEYYNHGYNIYL